ncbi:hypothetical protein JZ785_09100 [Alicyclobacillus curvatus]|nr:hypothetical protein JZ785_09100 [Alicyclobacillus curvatus]
MGFRFIMWGFLFTMLSFRVQGIDILPDFFGYILIATGLKRLSDSSPHFRSAIPWTFALFVLSLFEVYQRSSPFQLGYHVNTSVDSLFPLSGGALFGMLYSAVVLVLNLLVVHHICMGTADVALNRGNPAFADVAERRWANYFMFKVLLIVSIVVVFMFKIPPLAILIVVGMLVYSVAIAILMMTFMSEADRVLGS